MLEENIMEMLQDIGMRIFLDKILKAWGGGVKK
jgi:hypothetical protein